MMHHKKKTRKPILPFFGISSWLLAKKNSCHLGAFLWGVTNKTRKKVCKNENADSSRRKETSPGRAGAGHPPLQIFKIPFGPKKIIQIHSQLEINNENQIISRTQKNQLPNLHCITGPIFHQKMSEKSRKKSCMRFPLGALRDVYIFCWRGGKTVPCNIFKKMPKEAKK